MSKRIDWIDFAKGFTIAFVVLHHVLSDVDYSILSPGVSFIINNVFGTLVATVIMPIFFAISGYLYKNIGNFKEYILLIYKKVSSFVVAYIIINLLLLVNENMLLKKGSISSILYFPREHTWFLYSLFLIFVIYGIIDLLKLDIIYKSIVIFILFVLSVICHQATFPEFSPLKLTLTFIPCFFLGYLLKKYPIIEIMFKTKSRSIMLILITFSILIVNVIAFHLNGLNSNMTVKNIVPKLLLIIIIFKMFMIFPKNSFYNRVEKTGKYSLVVYLVHYLIVRLILNNVDSILGFSDVGYIISIFTSFVVVYTISLFVAWLCKFKIFSWIFFPRQFIDPLVKKTRFGKWIFSES